MPRQLSCCPLYGSGCNVWQWCNVLEINSKKGHVTYFVSWYLVKRITNLTIMAKDIYYKWRQRIPDVVYFVQVNHSHPIRCFAVVKIMTSLDTWPPQKYLKQFKDCKSLLIFAFCLPWAKNSVVSIGKRFQLHGALTKEASHALRCLRCTRFLSLDCISLWFRRLLF